MPVAVLYSIDFILALVLVYTNLYFQLKLITFLWAKGCSPYQALDIYDLRGKYNKWIWFDLILNSILMYSLSDWGILLGVIAIEAVACVSGPIRVVSSKLAIHNNPNLLDFNGKFKNTRVEYEKLVNLLDEKNLVTYKKSAAKLWSELLLLNKRRKEAYENKNKSEQIRADVQKLITTYTIEGDTDKRLKAQARLNKLLKQEADIDDFTRQVEERIRMSETVFMDIRTNLATGQLGNVLVDLDGYTVKIKSLELTVDQLER